jgi:hypothetical protein
LEEKIGALPDQTPAISEVGMDYRQLTKLLETGKWRKADEHTWEILLQISVREDEGWLSAADIDGFPLTFARSTNFGNNTAAGGLDSPYNNRFGKVPPEIIPNCAIDSAGESRKIGNITASSHSAKMLPPDTSPLPPGDIALVTVLVNSPQQKTLPALSGELLRAIANHPK